MNNLCNVVLCLIIRAGASNQFSSCFLLFHSLSLKRKIKKTMLASAKDNYYFFASFLLVVTAVLIKFPSLVSSAEFYAETMTIFFRMANESPFSEIVTFVGADYLVTFQLLVAYIVIRVFGIVEQFPGVVNFIFLLFVAFCVSLINLRVFRSLVASDFSRFMIGVSISLTPYLEVYQLLHANLFGVMIYFLFIFVDKNRIPAGLFYFAVFLMLMIGIARPNLIAFLPVYLVLFGISVYRHRLRDSIFYGVGCISLGTQAFVMLMSQLFWSTQKASGIYTDIHNIDGIFKAIFVAAVFYLRTLLSVIFKEVSGRGLLTLLLCLTIVVIISACFYLYRKQRYRVLYFFISSQFLAYALVYFICYSSPAAVGLDWSIIKYNPMRWWAYSNYVIYISLTVLAYNTVKEMYIRIPGTGDRNAAPGIAVAVVVMAALLFHIRPFYLYDDPYDGPESLSNWERYHPLIKNEDYFIPVNPATGFKWGLSKDNNLFPVNISQDNVGAIDFTLLKEDLLLRGILLENHDYQKSMKDLVIKVYDEKGSEIVEPRRLDDFGDKYLYYALKKRITPSRIAFYNERNEQIAIKPDLRLIGKISP